MSAASDDSCAGVQYVPTSLVPQSLIQFCDGVQSEPASGGARTGPKSKLLLKVLGFLLAGQFPFS